MTNLFSGPHTTRSAPSTSRLAASHVLQRLPAIRDRVLAWFLTQGPFGGADHELFRAVEGSVNSVRPRRCELTDENWLLDSGRRIKNDDGNECVLWVHRDHVPDAPPVKDRPGPRDKRTWLDERKAVVALLRLHHNDATGDVRAKIEDLAQQIAAGSHVI